MKLFLTFAVAAVFLAVGCSRPTGVTQIMMSIQPATHLGKSSQDTISKIRFSLSAPGEKGIVDSMRINPVESAKMIAGLLKQGVPEYRLKANKKWNFSAECVSPSGNLLYGGQTELSVTPCKDPMAEEDHLSSADVILQPPLIIHVGSLSDIKLEHSDSVSTRKVKGQSADSTATGSVEINIVVPTLDFLGKNIPVKLKEIHLSLSAKGEKTRSDTIPLESDGRSAIMIPKEYLNLAASTWDLYLEYVDRHNFPFYIATDKVEVDSHKETTINAVVGLNPSIAIKYKWKGPITAERKQIN